MNALVILTDWLQAKNQAEAEAMLARYRAPDFVASIAAFHNANPRTRQRQQAEIRARHRKAA
jgi:hypothetical protein